MKKILIATWTQHNNYGSLLQAYCLKKMIENLEKDTNHDIDQEVQVRLLNYSCNNPVKLNRNGLLKLFKKVPDKILEKIYSKYLSSMEKSFNNFRKNELALYPTKRIHSTSQSGKIKDFDLYIAGSDQIWNPKLLNEIYLLSWVPKNKPKFSYAPSICVKHLNNEELYKYKVLESFRALSVRERTGAVAQIEKKINRKIDEVVDPVILYGREGLLTTCRESKEEEYIFTYLLGHSKIVRNYCIDLAERCGLKLKTTPFVSRKNLKNDLKFMKYACWDVGPFELVNLIYNSRLLVTDSFHGLIIALLLHKDFVVLPREDGVSEQNNRLINLLKRINLEGRFGKMPKSVESVAPIDWNKVDEEIGRMRKSSLKYLKRALSAL